MALANILQQVLHCLGSFGLFGVGKGVVGLKSRLSALNGDISCMEIADSVDMKGGLVFG